MVKREHSKPDNLKSTNITPLPIKHSKLQAVVLTGARDSHNPLLAGTGLHSKVLLPIGGKPMVVQVMDALSRSRHQPDLYVSTNDPDVRKLPTGHRFEVLPSESRAVESMLKSLDRLPGEEWVLFASGDHPLLTGEMIDYFVEEVIRRDLTFGVAVVSRSEVNAHYPQSRRTWFPVKNNAYSGGNLFLINKRKFQGLASFMETIDSNRKKPWKSVFMFLGQDPLTILKILFRRLDMHQIARQASKLFQCEVGVVEMPFAECCMDVDKISDRDIAEIILQKRRKTFETQEERLPQRGSLGA